MPLEIFDSATAFANTRAPNASWPRKPEDQALRLTGIAKPRYTPSFQLDKSDRVFTVGSCFARNIEAQLIQLGMNVAAADLHFPPHLAVAGDRGAAMMNKFVVQSIESELRWALDPQTPFPTDTLWESRPGKFVDPHLGAGLAPQPYEEVIERRRIITEWFGTVRDAKVVIMTLGLAEAWFDRAHETYLNIPPPRSLRNVDPARLEVHILAYEDVIASLHRIHALLSAHLRSDWKMLVTVSPVALGTSFTGRDALLANTYSKAVQRAAVEAFVRGYGNVDYFPSFESITLSSRELAWEEDQAHASPMAIRSNMLRMVEAYVHGEGGGGASAEVDAVDCAQAAFLLDKKGDIKGADAMYAKASATSTDPNVLRAHGKFLFKLKRYAEAATVYEKAVAHGGEHFGIHFLLGNALWQLRRNEEAEAVLVHALEREPNRAGLLHLMAKVKNKLGKKEEARGLLERSLAVNPGNASAAEMLSQLQAEVALAA